MREGKARVPVLPKKVQIAFASLTGLAFVALLVFVLVRPTVAEPSIAKVEVEASIDGPSEGLSTVETKKPVVIAPEVADTVTTDGGATPAVEKEAPKAAETPTKETPEKEAPKAQEKPATTPKQYSYVARTGDSYTAIVRSAITLYAKNHGISLSPAQRVAAETFLVQKAGAPLLDQAQRVTISTDDVKSAVDQAQTLTDDELAAWDVFADQVDWDNDDTPEPTVDDAGASSTVDGGSVSGASVGGVGGASAGGGGGN